MRPRVGNMAAPTDNPAEAASTWELTEDSVADVWDRALLPFSTAAPEEQGTVGAINHHVSAAMGLVGLPFELLDTGFAVLTKDIAKYFEGQPAAVLGALHYGVPHCHAHPPSLVPGVPLLVPFPSAGAVACAGSVSVVIAGRPAARTSDMGPAPTCVGLAPFFEVYTGSSNTFFGGARAARELDITRACCPQSAMGRFGKALAAAAIACGWLGSAATAAGGNAEAAAMQALQAVADGAALAMGLALGKDPAMLLPGAPMGPLSVGAILNGESSVLVGGFPMIDTFEALMFGLGKLAKAVMKLAKKAGKKFKEKAKKQNHECDGESEPVDPVTGEHFKRMLDFEAPQQGGLFWERHYSSARCDDDGPLGFGFRHHYQLELTLTAGGAVLRDGSGRSFEFPRVADGARHAGTHVGRVLRQDSDTRFEVRFGANTLRFVRAEQHCRSARLVRWVGSGGATDFSYDSGRLVGLDERTQQGRYRTTLDHDTNGRIVTVTRQRGDGEPVVVARYDYDASGCMIRFVDALGHQARYAYDADRRMTQRTDRNGYRFSMVYDSCGRCVRECGEDGAWDAELRYEDGHTVVTRANGSVWTHHYDENGTVTRLVDEHGAERLHVVDERGLVIKEIDSGGRVTELLYDEHGHHYARRHRFGYLQPTLDEEPNPPSPLAHIVPMTHWTQQWGASFDGLGVHDVVAFMPESVRDAASTTLRGAPVPNAAPKRGHDAAGRLIEETDALGRQQRWAHDAEGNIVAHTDGTGRVTRYEVTSWNLIGAQIDPLGHRTVATYTPHEEVASVTDAAHNRSEYVYDHRDRLTAVHRHDVLRERYTYDQGDRLVEKRKGNGELLFRCTVGRNGLHNRIQLAGGETYRYEYDDRGRATRASSTEHEVELRRRHDGRRLLDQRDGRGVAHRYVGSRLAATLYFDRFEVRYTRDDDDGSLCIHTPVGGMHRISRDTTGTIVKRLGSGTTELSSYGPRGRCEGRVVSRGDRVWTARYTYSHEDELLSVHDSARGETRYTYDDAHRLTGEQRHDREAHYRYDPAGNLTASAHFAQLRYDQGNRLAQADGDHFEHNDRNHIALRREAGGRETHYTYDELDHLVGIRWSDSEVAWCAAYDGLGRRLFKQLGGARTNFYWDGDRLAAEVSPDGRVRIYVYPSEEALVAFMFVDYVSIDAEPEAGRAFFVFHNQVGMPQAIEDVDGQVVWWAERVAPYGSAEPRVGGSLKYALRWPGHYFDAETGLHDNRYRSYWPRAGRYLQSDPMGLAAGPNLYAYAASPLMLVDVLGLSHGRKDAASEVTQPIKLEKLDSLRAKDRDDHARYDDKRTFRDRIMSDIVDGILPAHKAMEHAIAFRERHPFTRGLEIAYRTRGLTREAAMDTLDKVTVGAIFELGVSIVKVTDDPTKIPSHADVLSTQFTKAFTKGNPGRLDCENRTLGIHMDFIGTIDPRHLMKELAHELNAAQLYDEMGSTMAEGEIASKIKINAYRKDHDGKRGERLHLTHFNDYGKMLERDSNVEWPTDENSLHDE